MLDFASAAENLLLEEGGYQNSPSDPGGETRFGISKRSYPDLDVKNLTKANALEIYERDFWKRARYGSMSDTLIAYKVFSFAVNMGPTQAHVYFQKAINEIAANLNSTRPVVKVDGVFGPKTLLQANWIDACGDSSALLFHFLKYAHQHYTAAARKQPDAYRGWINRIFFAPVNLKESL